MKNTIRLLTAEVLLVLALTVSGEAVTVEDAVVEKIASQHELDTASYELEILSNQLDSREIDYDQLSLKTLTQTEPLGLFTVLATISKDGELIEPGQVRLRIRKYAEVLVASDRIRRHELLSEEKLVLSRMEVTSLREQPVQSLGTLGNHRAKRNIRKGQILTTMAIEPVPDIEVGREVTIIAAKDLLTITAPGQALESGSIGDYVKVKNKATGKLLKARVVDGRSVALEL
jgi:flagella basal body P-ring formation protein FlgA